MLTKIKPISVKKGLGIAEHDTEGRAITAEFEKFYVVTTYTPNASRKLVKYALIHMHTRPYTHIHTPAHKDAYSCQNIATLNRLSAWIIA